jgi:cyclohexanone monooxygenase
VFQRTPSSVDLRGNKPTDPKWVASLKPGWQRQRAENFAEIISGRPVTEDLVNDGWTDIFRNNIASGFVLSSKRAQAGPEDMALPAELSDFAKMNRIRTRVDQVVQN